jgi:hypothetical protein
MPLSIRSLEAIDGTLSLETPTAPMREDPSSERLSGQNEDAYRETHTYNHSRRDLTQRDLRGNKGCPPEKYSERKTDD